MEPQLINSVLRRTNIMIAAAREATERAKFLEAFDTLKQKVNEIRDEHSRWIAVELYRTYKKHIYAMPDEPEHELRWKMKYLDELDHFKHLDPDEGSQN